MKAAAPALVRMRRRSARPCSKTKARRTTDVSFTGGLGGRALPLTPQGGWPRCQLGGLYSTGADPAAELIGQAVGAQSSSLAVGRVRYRTSCRLYACRRGGASEREHRAHGGKGRKRGLSRGVCTQQRAIDSKPCRNARIGSSPAGSPTIAAILQSPRHTPRLFTRRRRPRRAHSCQRGGRLRCSRDGSIDDVIF